MMEGNEPVLDICACPQLWRRSKEDAHFPGTHLCEQFRFFCLCTCFMDKSNFLPGDTFCHQLFPHVIIYIKSAVILRCGKVAENKLGRTVLCGFLPDVKGIFYTAVYLAVREIREHIVDEPLIQGALSSVIGDLEHVVLTRLHQAGAHHLRPVSKGTDQIFLLWTGLQHLIDILRFRHRKVEHIRCLNVR